jgi:pimeloyl-ACP methyl ester carboxylesterase
MTRRRPTDLLPEIRTTPPAEFKQEVARAELELRGVRAKAYQFPGGARDVGRALVCIAGMGADGRSFARQRELARDWFVLPLSTPFETPRGLSPIDFCADVIEEYIDSERLVRPVILGSSFGGAVAATVALRRHTTLGGLVLAGAVLSRRQIPLASKYFIDLLEAPEPVARLVAPMAAQIMGGFSLDRDGRDELVREARHFLGDELKRRLEALMKIDLLGRVTTLALPTLVIHGKRDLLVPWWRGKLTAEAIPGARFDLIDRAGHLPYLSHPELFNQAVAGFLGALETPRRAAAV